MSVKAAIEHLIDAINNAKCSGSGNGWDDIETAVHHARAELEKPELLMACSVCDRVTTPRLEPAFLAEEIWFSAYCANCDSAMASVKRVGWESLYEEQQKAKGNT